MNKTEKFWDKSAGGFTADEDALRIEGNRDYQITLKYLGKDAVVLDYGCGGGVVAINIADKVRAIHAIDVSPKMIEVARANAALRNIDNITFAPATIFDASFQKEQFDVILSFRVLHVLEDVPAALRRIHELLKPGGVFISVTPCISAYRVIFGPLFFLARITRLVPIRVQYFTFPKLQGLMTATGFEIVETEKMDDKIPTYCVVATSPAGSVTRSIRAAIRGPAA